MKRTIYTLAIATICGGGILSTAHAQRGQPSQRQQAQRQARQQSAPAAKVVATVNDEPIMQHEVESRIQRTLRGQNPSADEIRRLRKQVIDDLVETRLIEQYAREEGPGASPEEVKQQMQRLRQQLQAQDMTLKELIQQQPGDEQDFRRRIESSIAWQKLLQQRLTDAKLQQFYQANRQQFGGQSFQQAGRQVRQAYTGKLWDQIVQTMKPKAEIKKPGEEPSSLPDQNRFELNTP